MCWVSDPYDSVVLILYIPATRKRENGWSVNLSRGGEVAGTRPVEIGELSWMFIGQLEGRMDLLDGGHDREDCLVVVSEGVGSGGGGVRGTFV